MKVTYEQIREDARKACAELVEIAKLKQGDILVIGCNTVQQTTFSTKSVNIRSFQKQPTRRKAA